MDDIFDVAKDYVLKYTRKILNDNRKIVSPIPDDYLISQATKNNNKTEFPKESKFLATWGRDLPNWNDVYRMVILTFGKEGHNMMRVLEGENRSLNPRAENINKDGSVDRGLFQINSNTFADFMRRKPKKLYEAGIRSFEDMYDPEKNIKMAKIIWEEQGYNAWYGAPSYLRNKK